ATTGWGKAGARSHQTATTGGEFMSREKLPPAEASSQRATIDRRKFLKGVAATGAAVGLSAPASAAPIPASGLARSQGKARGPSVLQVAAEQDTPADVSPLTTKK